MMAIRCQNELDMKSTTIRFADAVYAELERASRLTGLPVNSIVTVACLEWLRTQPVPVPISHATQLLQFGRRWRRLETLAQLAPQAQPEPGDPLWIFTPAAQDVLSRAHEDAEAAGRPWIGTDHLLQGLYAIE